MHTSNFFINDTVELNPLHHSLHDDHHQPYQPEFLRRNQSPVC